MNKVYGVAFNDYEGKVKVNGKMIPQYRTWFNMLRRCYSSTGNPTYKDCTVCTEWLSFSNFKRWYDLNYFDGGAIDKDILYPGNRVYSPTTCIVISQQLNNFITDRSNARGGYLLGCWWDKSKNKFVAACSDPVRQKRHRLGTFDSEIEAHLAWKKYKIKLIHELWGLGKIPSLALKEALINRYK